MTDYRDILLIAGVQAYCEEAKLDFDTIFMQGGIINKANAYIGYEWFVCNNPTKGLRAGKVVYAVPKNIFEDACEAWYQIDLKFYHRILSLKQHEEAEGEVTIQEDDKFHPPEMRGKKWYYYDHDNPKPIKLSE